MCGIAGTIGQSRQDEDVVPRLWKAMAHRGPDDRGYLASRGHDTIRSRNWDRRDADSDVLFVHTRLAIIDVSPAGWQPMTSANGRYHIVYNGEIYNYLELRVELGLAHRFRSDSDTEVLLEAYLSGVGVSHTFERHVCFAVFDSQERRVFLARDYSGSNHCCMRLHLGLGFCIFG